MLWCFSLCCTRTPVLSKKFPGTIFLVRRIPSGASFLFCVIVGFLHTGTIRGLSSYERIRLSAPDTRRVFFHQGAQVRPLPCSGGSPFFLILPAALSPHSPFALLWGVSFSGPPPGSFTSFSVLRWYCDGAYPRFT
jgi:hypothetical protein